MKLQNLISVVVLVIFLLSSDYRVDSAQVIWDADKCTNPLGCLFSTIFTAVKATDDIIVKATNTLHPILIGGACSVNSLNVSSGILKVAVGGSLSVANDVLVQLGTSFNIEGTSTCGSLVLNGGSLDLSGSINVLKSITVGANVDVNGKINISGTITTPIFNCLSNSPIPTLTANAILNINGNSNLLSGINLSGSSILNVKTGVCIIDGLIESTASSVIQVTSTLNIINSVASTTVVNNIFGSIKLDPNSVLNLIGSNCIFNNIASIAATSSINLSKLAKLSILNQVASTISLGPINIDSTSILTIDKSNCLIGSTLQIVKGSLINILNGGSLKCTLANIDFVNDFNLQGTNSVLILTGATNTISGTVNAGLGSIVQLIKGVTCNFKKSCLLDSLLMEATAIINVVSNVTVNQGILCAPTSLINIDPVVGILNIGGKSVIESTLSLTGNSVLNIINGGICTLGKFTCKDTPLLNVFAGAKLIVNSVSDFHIPTMLNLHGNSILQLNADATISGLLAFPIEKIALPVLSLANSKCLLNGDIDPIGTVELVGSIITLGAKVVLDISNNLITDVTSNIIVGTGTNLIIGGPNSIVSNKLVIDGGKLNFEKGTTILKNGLNVSTSSFVFCNNAFLSIGDSKVSVDVQSVINGPFSITGSGLINIYANVDFVQGIQAPALKCPINIGKKAIVNLLAKSLISSPVYCLESSVLNIVKNGLDIIQFDGGISSELTAIISIDNSFVSVNATSNILGAIKLNEATLISCGTTILSNDIISVVSGKLGNNSILVNSGSCTINGKSTVDISGTINVLAKAALSITSSNAVACYGGIKNSGSLLIGSIVDLKGSIISQLNGDATTILLAGSNIITNFANFASGTIQGSGDCKITTATGFENGGIINGWLTIDGSLKLLDSSVIKVVFSSTTNVSKIICTGATVIDGLIDVEFDNDQIEASLKFGATFPVLHSDISITGNLSLSDSKESKQFSCQPPPTTCTKCPSQYNLVYQQTNTPPNKDTSSINSDDSTNSSSTLSSSFIYLLIISILLSSFLQL